MFVDTLNSHVLLHLDGEGANASTDEAFVAPLVDLLYAHRGRRRPAH